MNIVDVSNFGLMIFAFSKLKLILSGKYCLEYGLDYANLLDFPSFKVDQVPSNFNETVRLDDLKVPGAFIKPSIVHYLTEFWFFFWFLVFAIWALVYLVNLIRSIAGSSGNNESPAELDVRSGNSPVSSPARGQQAKNESEAV